MDFDKARELIKAVLSETSKVIVGKRSQLETIVCALFSEGHVLIEGPPGTGKTLTARALARALGGEFGRIQGHPDILPSDITGFHIYQLDGTRRLVRGPIFSHIVFFDELNRTPTRSQAALLEAMEERQVTIDGVTYELRRPFMIIATQIPLPIAQGVYPVIETLRDRFMVSIESEYSTPEEEYEIVVRSDEIAEFNVEPVATPEEAGELIESIPKLVHVSDRVVKYIVDLLTYIRRHEAVDFGPGHRVAIALYRLARVHALLEGRDYAIPDDVKRFMVEAIAHRLWIKPDYEAEGVTARKVVEEALESVVVPKE